MDGRMRSHRALSVVGRGWLGQLRGGLVTTAPTPPNLPRLSGIDRAAILLLGLPSEHMGKVMELLNEDEIRSISRTMSRLGKVDPAVMEAVCNDFMARLAAGGVLVGSHESTERLLRNALIGRDELVDSIMQEVRGPTTTGSWERVT